MQARWPSLYRYPYALATGPLEDISADKHRQMRQAALLQMLSDTGDEERRRACEAYHQVVLTAPSALSGLHIFWINADDNLDRRRRMEAELGELGIRNHTRVPAVVLADIQRWQARGLELKGLRLVEQVHRAPSAVPAAKWLPNPPTPRTMCWQARNARL
jgi:hypothetical protein